jgi:hypothetical protein
MSGSRNRRRLTQSKTKENRARNAEEKEQGLSAARRSGRDRVPNSLMANGRPGSHAVNTSVRNTGRQSRQLFTRPGLLRLPFRVLGEEFGQAADSEGYEWSYGDQTAARIADDDLLTAGLLLEFASDCGEVRVDSRSLGADGSYRQRRPLGPASGDTNLIWVRIGDLGGKRRHDDRPRRSDRDAEASTTVAAPP